MEKHMLMCFFISMLCGKIKFEIDINNDEQLITIWEKYKVGGWILLTLESCSNITLMFIKFNLKFNLTTNYIA
jgi:hypothetical protein